MASTISSSSSSRLLLFSPRLLSSSSSSPRSSTPKSANRRRSLKPAALLVTGAGFALASAASANAISLDASMLPLALALEPSNALSLPTWVIHVSSVVEWMAAMALVWEYGEKSGFRAWKGLSWGMVPLLGGAMCACTWHFFYNSESLEILVALQGALTVIGNMTMCIAAFRIFKASQEGSKSS
ncbi:uncharacterized protein [Typha latifolia]|uniref:uncharacterized protein n=1 Tax=Typha latifolia TaxID=4733 RepID=UPI003C2ED46D